MSQTHARRRLAIALKSRNRTGSASAFSFVAISAAASSVSGSRSSGGVAQQRSARSPESTCIDIDSDRINAQTNRR
ncbi:hypothetical protein [Mycolicibacterium arabiense]|uniref:hypothetical protein n=1 Tax=Mycolicibacterium arabiense TaxID=1286181 RepID=UPI001F300CEB|nr:hypothetical protein [Mycolicibacterium arabiense]